MSILLGFLTILIIPPLVIRILIFITKRKLKEVKQKERTNKLRLIANGKDAVVNKVKVLDKQHKKKADSIAKRREFLLKTREKLEALKVWLQSVVLQLKLLLHTIHVIYFTIITAVVTIIMPMWLFIIIMFFGIIIVLVFSFKDDIASLNNNNPEVAQESGGIGINEVYLNTVLSADVQEIIQMSDTEVWQLISGGRFKTKAEADKAYQADKEGEEAFWKSMVTEVEVPCWKWSDSSKTEKVSSTCTITVNKALVNYWIAFMNDLYACSDKYVVNEVGGFNVRPKNNGTHNASLSAHSFGAVLDINPSSKGMGSNAAGIGDGTPWNSCNGLSEPYRSECCCFDGNWHALLEKYDLDWGGNWSARYLDPMHFSIVGDNKKGTKRNTPKTGGQSPK